MKHGRLYSGMLILSRVLLCCAIQISAQAQVCVVAQAFAIDGSINHPLIATNCAHTVGLADSDV